MIKSGRRRLPNGTRKVRLEVWLTPEQVAFLREITPENPREALIMLIDFERSEARLNNLNPYALRLAMANTGESRTA